MKCTSTRGVYTCSKGNCELCVGFTRVYFLPAGSANAQTKEEYQSRKLPSVSGNLRTGHSMRTSLLYGRVTFRQQTASNPARAAASILRSICCIQPIWGVFKLVDIYFRHRFFIHSSTLRPTAVQVQNFTTLPSPPRKKQAI